MQSPNNENEGIKNDNYFRCEICVVWFNDIDDFFLHILEEHQHIEVLFSHSIIILFFTIVT